MPIRAENKALYPKNWKSEIVPRIRARSGNRCECTGQCGKDHKGRCKWKNGDLIDNIRAKIVLTVMHLNHNPEDCSDENLLHGCQGCHNRYDAPMRRRGIKERRRAQMADGDLFKCEEP